MTNSNNENFVDPWLDDVLERRQLGKVLEDHLINRFVAGNHEPLSLALDGRWGSGKTFFVERWTKQLQANDRFVINFNAWQHDGAPEPALALISELQQQIKEISGRIISEKKTAKEIERKVNAVMTSAKKAIKPVLLTLASGVMKRSIGASIDDFSSALAQGASDERAVGSQDLMSKAVDVYVDQMLAGYQKHQASISQFRDDLQLLADSIAQASIPGKEERGPLIIIIDELDRCRPNFAVQLLEGVKHLFSVNNVCFVFTTNLAQLTASIQVVYGANFNGREYLGRFFDRELTLPKPSGPAFAKTLFQQSLPKSIEYGDHFSKDTSPNDRRERLWLDLCEAMGLTLRQQLQAFSIFRTSCESYPPDTEKPGLWLMFLSQLKCARPSVFDDLHLSPRSPSSAGHFKEKLEASGWKDILLLPNYRRHQEDGTGGIGLADLICEHIYYSKLSKRDAYHELDEGTNRSSRIHLALFSFVGGIENRDGLNSLHSAFDIVSAAGMFSYCE